MPDENKPVEEKLDLDQIKSMLDLPQTATDVELITTLVNLAADLQDKYEALLADSVAMEDKLVNRELEDYADVIPEASIPYWKEQVLTNRSLAIEALTALREKIPAAPEPAAPVEEPAAAPAQITIPLRNRLSALERPVTTFAQDAAAKTTSAVAVQIRNRATEIQKAEKIPFYAAFSRAEKEFIKE